MIELKVLYPGKLLDVSGVPREICAEMRRQGSIYKRYYERTVRTWKTKPGFTVKVSQQTGDYVLEIRYDPRTIGGQHYQWVDWGTEAHTITAKRVPMLKFQSGFTSKTRRHVLGSRKGGRSGPWVSKKSVRHPGTEAREFTCEIANRRRNEFNKQIARAVRAGIKWHGEMYG